MKIDWNAEAQKAVGHIQAKLSEVHRGAFFWHEPLGVVLIFDNRRSKDPIPTKLLTFVKQACERHGGTFRALVHSEDGETWAILATDVDPAWAHDCVWAAWHSACSETAPEHFRPLDLETFVAGGDIPLNNMGGRQEYDIARKTIAAHFSNENKWQHCQPE